MLCVYDMFSIDNYKHFHIYPTRYKSKKLLRTSFWSQNSQSSREKWTHLKPTRMQCRDYPLSIYSHFILLNSQPIMQHWHGCYKPYWGRYSTKTIPEWDGYHKHTNKCKVFLLINWMINVVLGRTLLTFYTRVVLLTNFVVTM